MTSLDFGPRFSNCASFELGGNWPAGLSIDNAGLVTGSATVAGIYKNLWVTGISASGKRVNSSTFSISVSKFGALVPSLSGEMQGVGVGVGGLTTTHTAALYAPDVDGVYRQFAANEPVWSGGRRVTNFAKSTEDFSAWEVTAATFTGGYTDPEGGNTAYRLTATGVNGLVRMSANGSTKYGGQTRVVSWWIRRVSGAGQITVYAGTSTSTRPDVSSVVTSSWQRIALSPNTYSYNSVFFGVVLPTSGDSVELWHPSWADITGMSSQNPPEYVPNTSTATNSDYGLAYYANANGNTVLNNVVTEAVGAPLAEVPYLQYYPAATNSQKYSNDVTQWSGIETVAFDQIGLTGEPNTASLFTGTSAGYRYLSTDVVTTIVPCTAVFYVKYEAVETIPIGLTIGAAGTNTTNRVSYYLNKTTGIATYYAAGSGASVTVYSSEVIRVGDWWKVLINFTPFSTGNTFGTLIKPSSTASSNSSIIGNVEVYVNKTIAQVRGLGPIFTTTAAVSTDRTICSVDSANHESDESAYFVESNFSAHEGCGVGEYIIGRGGSARIIYGNGAYANIQSYDGATIVGVTAASLADDTNVKLGTVYSVSENSRAIYFDGAINEGVTAAMGGTGDLIIGWSTNSPPVKIRNLRRYDIASYQAGKDIIEELMGMNVLNSGGSNFSMEPYVLDGDGNLFSVPKTVLDSDGNSFGVI